MNKLLFLCIGFIAISNTIYVQFETKNSDELFISLLTDNFYVNSHRMSQIVVKLKIEGIEKNGGKIYTSIFNSEHKYRVREPYCSFSLNSDKETVIKELVLPAGQYVFSIYQDSNKNGKLDSNLIGIPREKFGFTNYDGKSSPGGFNRHKVQINEKVNEVVVTLIKI